jgi:hypothetical protein
MTFPPPELPSFQSFVESTKVSPRHQSLPDRCADCTAIAHVYEIVDIRCHHDSPHDGEPHDGFFSPAEEDSSTASTCNSSSCSCDDVDADDQTMSESAPDSPSAVSDAHAKPRRRHLLKSNKKTYLTEQQRYEIVCRVLSGAKQAHVARQYGVTRAAVSYLLKHHAEIMHRVLTTHANCCLQRAAATAVAMDTTA